MIDIEKEIYTPLEAALREAHPGISVSGEEVLAPSEFPFVSAVEADNYMTKEHMDTADAERFATIMYAVNVYSNKGVMKKSECRAIMATIDRFMYAHNFTCITKTPVPNMNNASIYRMTAFYRAETDGTNLYRR